MLKKGCQILQIKLVIQILQEDIKKPHIIWGLELESLIVWHSTALWDVSFLIADFVCIFMYPLLNTNNRLI